MRSRPLSIAGWMGFVALAAFDIALGRFVAAANIQLFLGAVVPFVILQGAVYRWCFRQGRARAFWLGFMVCGSLITASFVWAMLFPEVNGITRAGAIVKTPGSPMYSIWMRYGSLGDRIAPLFVDLETDDPEPFKGPIAVSTVLLWTLPQLLIALAGGLLAWGLSRLKCSTKDRSHEAEPVRFPTQPIGNPKSGLWTCRM